MTKEERYWACAQELLKLVGGKENIISAAHCATRLRLVLKDESKADLDGILKVDLVKGQFANGGQFQIIIGSGTVNEVYKRFIEAGGIAEATKILTPLLTVMVTGFVTFTLVGGIMRTAGDMLTNSFVWMHDTLGIVGGMVLGFLYSPLTMTGMHHSLLPVDIQMVAAGGSFLLAIASCNNVAQGGATLCAMVRTKDKKLKSVAATSGVSAMLGITEPAMFGVNLKLKYPFYGAMMGAALGGGYVTLTNVLNTAPGTAGIVGFVCVPASSMLNFLIGTAISIGAGFIFTYILSNLKKFNKELEKKEDFPEDKTDRTRKAVMTVEKNVICSPLTGTAIPMSQVPDGTFAAEVLGKGMAVIPLEGKVVSPCEGRISALFDTKHAIGITTKEGTELLIHVGVNTVELKGKYYEAHVAQGDEVKPGQLILTFDIQKTQEAGYPVVTPVIIANTEAYKSVEGIKTGEIHCMEPLMKLEEQ